jgi:hypothetical protein
MRTQWCVFVATHIKSSVTSWLSPRLISPFFFQLAVAMLINASHQPLNSMVDLLHLFCRSSRSRRCVRHACARLTSTHLREQGRWTRVWFTGLLSPEPWLFHATPNQRIKDCLLAWQSQLKEERWPWHTRHCKGASVLVRIKFGYCQWIPWFISMHKSGCVNGMDIFRLTDRKVSDSDSDIQTFFRISDSDIIREISGEYQISGRIIRIVKWDTKFG